MVIGFAAGRHPSQRRAAQNNANTRRRSQLSWRSSLLDSPGLTLKALRAIFNWQPSPSQTPCSAAFLNGWIATPFMGVLIGLQHHGQFTEYMFLQTKCWTSLLQGPQLNSAISIMCLVDMIVQRRAVHCNQGDLFKRLLVKRLRRFVSCTTSPFTAPPPLFCFSFHFSRFSPCGVV